MIKNYQKISQKKYRKIQIEINFKKFSQQVHHQNINKKDIYLLYKTKINMKLEKFYKKKFLLNNYHYNNNMQSGVKV